MGTKQQSGPNNHNWKGGRIIEPRGYVLVRVGKNHHLADVRGYAYEHRLVAEKKLGRRLRKGEEIHHKKANGDNAPSDIDVKKSRAHHFVEHRTRTDLKHPDEPNPRVLCECGCGSVFPKFDRQNRPRRFVSGHNLHA